MPLKIVEYFIDCISDLVYENYIFFSGSFI